jgi:hypothetical protein
MFAENILLEPWYSFALTVPESAAGRAMTDLDRMSAVFSLGGGTGGGTGEETGAGNGVGTGGPGEDGFYASGGEIYGSGMTVISGKVPVSEIRNYADEVRAYTKGEGRLSVRLLGYFPCHNADEVIDASGYDPELDPENSPDSVFCSHGVGTVIPWYDVPEYMHLLAVLETGGEDRDSAEGEGWSAGAAGSFARRSSAEEGPFLSVEEVDAILARAGSANRKSSGMKRPYGQRRRYKETLEYEKRSAASAEALRNAETVGGMERRKEFFLVDGYNIIFAWPELNALAEANIDSARLALQDAMADYQGYRGSVMIVVLPVFSIPPYRLFSMQIVR